MGIFGPPDIEKLLRSRNYNSLIKTMNHEDSQIVSDAAQALNKLAFDEQAIAQRKQHWNLELQYTPLLKKISNLDQQKQESLKPLLQAFQSEQEPLLDKKSELDGLKKRFVEHFGSTNASELFFERLISALEKDEKIIFAQKELGQHTLSKFGGIIVTDQQIFYFDLGLTEKLVNVKFKDVESTKDGFLRLKVVGKDGSYIKFNPQQEEREKILSYIDNRVAELTGKIKPGNEGQDLITATCSLCQNAVEGKPLSWDLFLKKEGKYIIWQRGLQCQSCGAHFCLKGHKKELNFSRWSGYEKSLCPRCQTPLRSGNVLLDKSAKIPQN